MKKNTFLNGGKIFSPFVIFLISIISLFGTQEIYSQNCSPDTEAPVASNVPANENIACFADKPAPVAPTFDDNCDNDPQIFFSEIIPPSGAGCALTDSGPGSAPGIWSVLLRDPTGQNPIPGYTDKWILDQTYPANGFEDFGDGTGRLTGKVMADNNPNQWFLIDVYVEDKMDWNTWSTTLTTDGTTFRTAKDDAGHAAAGGNLWTGWDFFVINPNDARLIGGGDLAGTWLELVPAPSNLFFGFQVGQAANDRQPGFGLSSWFTYTGFINDNGNVTSFSGLGDFNMLLSCPPIFQPQCGDYNIERSWAAVDEAGNATLVTQTIYVEPESAPVFSEDCPPSEITLSCDDPVPAAVVLTAERSNCSNEPNDVAFEEVEYGEITCLDSIVRTWSSIYCDSVGCKQLITFVDECDCDLNGDVIKPVLAIPNDNTVECDEPIPPPFWDVSDNCDNDVEVVTVDEIIPGTCPQEYIIERTYTATDDCGNTVSDVQIIYVVDTTPPTVTGQDFEISCDTDINGLPLPIGVDNCDNNVTVVLDQVITVKGDCPWNFSLERHWIGIDDCGNVGDYIQYITVSDTDPPLFNYGPTNEVVPCHNIPDPVPAMAFDYCQNDYVDVDFNEVIIPGECQDEYTIIRTWYAEDDCGNGSSITRTLNVTDNIDPYWTYIPWDMYIECDDDIPPPSATAEDLCDDDVEIIVGETTIEGDCYGEYSITRVYTATDNCGNSISTTQHIYVLDVTPPYISVYEPVVYVPIGGSLPGWNGYSVWDNCDPDPYVVISDDGQAINCVEDEIIRTYTAFDDCGNSSSVSQLIYVKYEDETPPVAKCHNITRHLDYYGYVYVNPWEIDGEWHYFGPEIGFDWYYSYDNCEISDMWLSQNLFTCYDVGVNEVILYVEDYSKNVSTCTAYITIVDSTAPTLSCVSELNKELNEDGLAFLEWEEAINFYYDACGIEYINISPTILNAQSLNDPDLHATVTAVDNNGNVSTCDVPINLSADFCELPYFISPPWGTNEDFSLYYLHLSWAEYAQANACKILGNKVTKAWDYSITVGDINTPGAPTQKDIWMGNLSPATEYRWKMRCGCSNNPFVWSPYNDYQYFTTPSQAYYDANGIEIDQKNQFFGSDLETTLEIYPNPNNGEFIVNTNLSLYNIELTDVTGKVVYSRQNVNQSSYQIELTDLSSGMYQLSIFNEHAIRSEKVSIREL